MGSKFFVTTIGEQLTLQRGFDITKNEQVDGRVPVVSSGGISSFHNEFKVKGPGVILGRKGSLGTVYYIEENFWPHDTTLWVKDFKGNNPRFVYYFFTMMADSLKKMDVGAANPSLNRNHIHPLPTKWPIKSVQDGIEEAISPIEEKINLNRQINQTLEQMAQTLFKSWFVDFDPVIDNALDAGNEIPDTLQERAEQRRLLRAKADFKPLPAETRALFPSEFEETELGWVPKGWQIRQIKDVVERISVGKKYSQKELKPTGLVPVLDQAKTGVIGYHENAAGVNASIDNPVITFANHTCVTRLITYDFSTIQNVLPFKFKGLDIFWTYLATQGKQQFEEYKGHWPDFEIQEITIPNEIISSYFGRIVRPYFEKIVTNEKMNEILIAIRDSLLPKLISGELALDDLPEDVAEAAEAL